MQKYPHVFISILNYNDGKTTLKNCLDSLFAIDYPNFSVIVADNASNDGSLEVAQSAFPQVLFIKNEKNLGFSAGNNIGIRLALEKGADYILLLNNDTLVEKDFLNRLIEVGKKDDSVGILCPLIFEGDRKTIWFSSGRIDWLQMKTSHTRENIKENFYNAAFISGCAMLVSSKVFREIGLFDERYFLYWEDADFSVRAKRAGFRTVVCPLSKIYHLEQSNKHSIRKTYYLVLSGLIFFKKNSSWFLRPWMNFYITLRKTKNWLDRKINKNDLAEAVHKAYNDFKDVRF